MSENLNYWIDPQGRFYSCENYDFPCHNRWAESYLQDKWKIHDYFDFKNHLEKESNSLGDAYEYLHTLGWARIIDWRREGGKLNLGYQFDKKITKKQKNALFNFCKEHKLDYELLQ